MHAIPLCQREFSHMQVITVHMVFDVQGSTRYTGKSLGVKRSFDDM